MTFTGKWMEKMRNDLGFWQYTTRFGKPIRQVLAINICFKSQLAINEDGLRPLETLGRRK